MKAITRVALIALVLAGLPGPGYAQEVAADRIVHGSEFIPRFTDLPNVLTVPAGKTVTLPPDSTWDAIEVAGTLKVSRAHDTVCRFIHLTVLPGGTLDMGTVQDPVLTRVEFIVRDVAIDTRKDPYQWGNGIINLGHQSRVGRKVAHAWTELDEDVNAGATTLRLTVPDGWQVGDELLLPDTRQANGAKVPVRRESKVTIASISRNGLTLSKPLDFEHTSVRDPDGAIVVRPRVANLTRNIVIRSENPLGVRGHTVNTGAATWDIRYNQLIGLGRTRAEKLHSTAADAATGAIVEIGTNQIARYASHDHHVHAHGHGKAAAHHAGGHFIGNVLDGTGIGKWGHVVHGTHDTHVEENVAIDFVGAGFVTEDGYEVRNVFRRNVAAYAAGNGIDAIGNVNARAGRDCPGCEGSAFWFRGSHQVIEGNEAWNSVVGINVFMLNQVLDHKVPSVPGGEPDKPFDPRKAVPVSFADNVAIANKVSGLEYWGTPVFPAVGQISVHNGGKQVFAGQSNVNVYLVNPTLVASGGRTTCISSSEAYAFRMEVDGGRMAGCDKGLIRGGGRVYVRLRNLLMQNRTNIDFVGSKPPELLLENVVHRQYLTFPKRYVVLGDGKDQTSAPGDFTAWKPQRGPRIVVKNWQGTGQDYLLFESEQLASKPAWPANGDASAFFCPESNLTMGQCWEKYGMAYRGATVRDDEAVELEGLVSAVAKTGSAIPLGVPRAVVTLPNMLFPAKVTNGKIRLRVLLTGDPGKASDVAVVQVDGSSPVRRAPGPRGPANDERSFDTTAVKPGMHTVKTWRESPKGAKIPESEMTFTYFVEEASGETATNAASANANRPRSNSYKAGKAPRARQPRSGMGRMK